MNRKGGSSAAAGGAEGEGGEGGEGERGEGEEAARESLCAHENLLERANG
ncbi:MAG: hypothetical protein LBL48_09300 [Azoarcus sp.]|nr:hypothetical protein [Azoarcus sp.]